VNVDARRLRSLAAEKFGWPRLRDEQVEAMLALMAGDDVLAVLPTGAGKSAIYQVPALLLDGPTVVVSPLLALQRDQIDSLDDRPLPGAVALNSRQRAAERREAWEALRGGAAEYLFLAPEQLAKEDVVAGLRELGVSLFVVDEAHCVSSWGHDFRPDYLRLAPVVEALGRPRVVALTATAAQPVRDDIVTRLGLRRPRQVVASFDRPNLHLAAREFTDDGDKRAAVLDHVTEVAGRGGLLYTASRRDTGYYAGELAGRGVRAMAYHGGMRTADRDRVHRAFHDGDVDVVVATSAFGMGIDRPDVRFVAHASIPESLDSYYQQIGRAGRDGEPAEILLHHRPEDLALQKFLNQAKAPLKEVRSVATELAKQRGPIPVAELAGRVPGPSARRTRAVNLLEQAGALTVGEGGLRLVAPDVDNAVEGASEAAGRHAALVRSRLEMMRGYAETTGCRRQYLLGYFGEHLADPCGRCDTCEAGTVTREPAGDGEFRVTGSVRHRDWGRGVVMAVETDRLTVLFDEVGYRTLSLPAVREQDVLAAEGTPS
jgi:ATP-dependent DNA helicase RecQ